MRFTTCPLLAVVGSILCCVLASANDDNQLPPLPNQIPFTLTAHGSGTSEPVLQGMLEFHEGEASWEPPHDVEFSFARRLSLSARCKEWQRECKLDLTYECQGPRDAGRRFCFETRALDRDGKLLAHDWQVDDDNRLGPKELPWGRFTMQLSRYNSPFNELSREALGDVAKLDIRLIEYPSGTPRHFPNGPQKLDLAITRTDRCGNFDVTFANPSGWSLDPPKHQIAFELWVRDTEDRNVRREVRLLSYRADGKYRQRVHVERKYFDYSFVSIAVFTRQPDNRQFVRDFFIDRVGSAYQGMWTGDGGKLVELPIQGVPLFDDLPKIAAVSQSRAALSTNSTRTVEARGG